MKAEKQEVFVEVIVYNLEENGYHLAGAVHDFIAPNENGQRYMFCLITPTKTFIKQPVGT